MSIVHELSRDQNFTLSLQKLVLLKGDVRNLQSIVSFSDDVPPKTQEDEHIFIAIGLLSELKTRWLLMYA